MMTKQREKLLDHTVELIEAIIMSPDTPEFQKINLIKGIIRASFITLTEQQREEIVNELHGVLNYELTENFDALEWSNDGWKDEIYSLIDQAITKIKGMK
jgi:hypothetical protein